MSKDKNSNGIPDDVEGWWKKNRFGFLLGGVIFLATGTTLVKVVLAFVPDGTAGKAEVVEFFADKKLLAENASLKYKLCKARGHGDSACDCVEQGQSYEACGISE